eukprot:COSAG05_NODE_16626_length_342_cov_0.559671_1_plen_107_part_10
MMNYDYQCNWGLFLGGNPWEAKWSYTRLGPTYTCEYGFYRSGNTCLGCDDYNEESLKFTLKGLLAMVFIVVIVLWIWTSPSRMANHLDNAVSAADMTEEVLGAIQHG